MQPRHFRARQKSSDVRRMSVSSDASTATTVEHKHHVSSEANNSILSDSDLDNKVNIKKMMSSSSRSLSTMIKKENSQDSVCGMDHEEEDSLNTEQNSQHEVDIGSIKRRKSEDGGSICSSFHEGTMESSEHNSIQLPRKKNTLRTQLAQQIMSSGTKTVKKPSFVVRPATNPNLSHSISSGHHYALDSKALFEVFRYLPQETLITCSGVCKTWSTVSVDPRLWQRMNCAHHKLSASLLMAIVRRQPEHLILDWTSLAKRQLAWLISRLPALKNLSIQGTQISSVLGLHTCLCPPLQKLDLSFVRSLNDSAVRDILSPPKDSRPGLTDSKSRLRNLKVLKLAGTDISDVALRYITQGVPSLIHLNISSCQRVTDAGVAQIGTCPSAINTLVELDLSNCKLVTENCLEYLAKCEALTYLDLRHVPQVSTQAVIRFAAKSKHNLHVRDVKLVDRRK